MIVYQCVGEPPEEEGNEWIYDDKVFVSKKAAEARCKELDLEQEQADNKDFYYFFLYHLELVQE